MAEHPNADTIADWAAEAMAEMVSILGESVSQTGIDLASAAIGDRLHAEVWPTCRCSDVEEG